MLTGWINRWRRKKRRHARDNTVKALATLIAGLIAVSTAHTNAMMWLEDMSLTDALWLTATTLTTVGYGDLSATTSSGRLATVMLLYVGGIWILGKTVGDWFDIRAERNAQRRNGRWRWKMDNHLLVVNTPKRGSERYFARLMDELGKSTWGKGREVVVVTKHWNEGMPAGLSGHGIMHVTGNSDSAEALERASARNAAAILVLIEDLEDEHADALTFNGVHRLREHGIKAPITVEVVDDANRERMKNAGADTVLRALRSYPELTIRALSEPATTEILTGLFTSEGSMCIRFKTAERSRIWKELVIETLDKHGASAIGYEERGSGKIICAPYTHERIDAQAVIGVRKTV